MEADRDKDMLAAMRKSRSARSARRKRSMIPLAAAPLGQHNRTDCKSNFDVSDFKLKTRAVFVTNTI